MHFCAVQQLSNPALMANSRWRGHLNSTVATRHKDHVVHASFVAHPWIYGICCRGGPNLIQRKTEEIVRNFNKLALIVYWVRFRNRTKHAGLAEHSTSNAPSSTSQPSTPDQRLPRLLIRANQQTRLSNCPIRYQKKPMRRLQTRNKMRRVMLLLPPPGDVRAPFSQRSEGPSPGKRNVTVDVNRQVGLT